MKVIENMYYVRTRDVSRRLTASQAIVEGLSRDGGLYLPEQIRRSPWTRSKRSPRFPILNGPKIMKRYLDEFTEEELLGFEKCPTAPRNLTHPPLRPS